MTDPGDLRNGYWKFLETKDHIIKFSDWQIQDDVQKSFTGSGSGKVTFVLRRGQKSYFSDDLRDMNYTGVTQWRNIPELLIPGRTYTLRYDIAALRCDRTDEFVPNVQGGFLVRVHINEVVRLSTHVRPNWDCRFGYPANHVEGFLPSRKEELIFSPPVPDNPEAQLEIIVNAAVNVAFEEFGGPYYNLTYLYEWVVDEPVE